ncbi:MULTISPECIES: hypothetical protein [unclassified Providencia]|uniref:hypothetical protein n=1 Tax=unclassified Providencia TaxID=2633465 RepID=UPI00234B5583|nr:MULTISPECIES: hypothetical protein [unclassified Providencia]
MTESNLMKSKAGVLFRQMMKDTIKTVPRLLSEESKYCGKNSINYSIHEEIYDETKLQLEKNGFSITDDPSQEKKDGLINVIISSTKR